MMEQELQWKSCGVGLCLEVARSGDEVLLRDSRQSAKVIAVDVRSWDALVQAVKRGEFDRL